VKSSNSHRIPQRSIQELRLAIVLIAVHRGGLPLPQVEIVMTLAGGSRPTSIDSHGLFAERRWVQPRRFGCPMIPEIASTLMKSGASETTSA
jgi:hypothetical protein